MIPLTITADDVKRLLDVRLRCAAAGKWEQCESLDLAIRVLLDVSATPDPAYVAKTCGFASESEMWQLVEDMLAFTGQCRPSLMPYKPEYKVVDLQAIEDYAAALDD